MKVLDPYVRCNGCRRVVTNESHEVCSFCHGKLAEVGTRNGFLEWKEYRERGKWRYVIEWVGFYGVSWACIWCLWTLLMYGRSSVAMLPWLFATWLAMWFFHGWVCWWISERQYHKWVADNPKLAKGFNNTQS